MHAVLLSNGGATGRGASREFIATAVTHNNGSAAAEANVVHLWHREGNGREKFSKLEKGRRKIVWLRHI
jgi:hypothetical protein